MRVGGGCASSSRGLLGEEQRCIPVPRGRGQRFILPGQWSGLPWGEGRPRREVVAVQIPAGEVERRSLEVYELAVVGGAA